LSLVNALQRIDKTQRLVSRALVFKKTAQKKPEPGGAGYFRTDDELNKSNTP
jgi:hypothetical protein